MNALYWVNRALWATIVLIIVGGGTLAFLYEDPSQSPVEPLALPTVRPGIAPAQNVFASGRNPFDPEGRPWHPKVKAQNGSSGPIAHTAAGIVIGIVSLPGNTGVFTRDRFIPIGGSIDGGTLLSVTERAAVIQTPQGNKELRLQSGGHPSWDSLTGGSASESKE